MLYENYLNLKVYNSQSRISIPKAGVDSDGARMSTGHGAVIFLLTPNIDKALNVLKDDTIGWNQSMFRNFTMDTYYRRKIGTKTIAKNEKIAISKKMKENKDLNMVFQIPTTVRTVVKSKRNLVVDLSRWMDLFFTNYTNPNAEKRCSVFLSILKDLLNNPMYADYKTKLIMIDMNSWCAASDCVILNKKLLTNPLSIFFYTAVRYPSIWETFGNHRVLLANRSAHQVLLFNTSDITKKTYPQVKSKVKLFKNLVFSIEDETSTDELSDEEVRAEMVEDAKNSAKKVIKAKSSDKAAAASIPDPFKGPVIDLTQDLEEDENEDSEEEDPLSEEESKALNQVIEENPDIVFDDPKKIADATTKKEVYIAPFMPERTQAQIEKNQRMAVNQEKVIGKPDKDTEKKKTLDITVYPTNIENNNPTLMSSKFTNFDRNYVSKCMTSDIDNSVGILSNASEKIFITNKEVVDASTPMDLKETWIYTLQDEKGNKKTIKLDIPKVIDGTYIFINGAQQLITHQFVLKPLVKTDQDTVQLVTAYNKVFIRRHGQVDANTNNLIVYLQQNKSKFKAREGNFSMMNKNYDVPLDFIMISKHFGNFTIGDVQYYMDIDELLKYIDLHYKSKKVKINFAKEIPIGLNTKTHQMVLMPLTSSYGEVILHAFSEADQKNISKIKKKPRLIVADAKMMGKDIPVILFCMYCEGLKSVLSKAKVDYIFTDSAGWKTLDKTQWDGVQLEDCILAWKKKNIATSLLMNGLKNQPLTSYTKEEMESKDTFMTLCANYFGNDSRIASNLDNYRDFLLDSKAKEMLKDFGYPTDLVSVFLTAINMLSDNRYLAENNMENMRIRSTEVISDVVYRIITQAYETYRKQAHKKNALTSFQIKQSAVIDGLLRSSSNSSKGKRREVVTNLVVPASVLNPVLELEKSRAVTYKGLGGIQLDRAMTLNRRSYDKSMLGVCGITTSPDANVGVVRQLTLEPNITSTRGYIDTSNQDNPDDLNAAQLFTTAELLTPIGVTHDDPDRTSMSYKQTKYMISVDDADPVMIGNRVEAITPYILSDEFIVTAKQDGEVVAVDGDYVVVKYKDGTNQAIDIGARVKKNASAGFYVDNTLKCDLKLGDKVKKDDVLAYNDKQFKKHKDDKGASMSLGVLTKVAIVSSWDIYEDSTPITTKLANKLATYMVHEKAVTLSPNTIVDKMVKVGDKVATGDALIKFSTALSDEMQAVFNSMRDKGTLDEITEDTKTTVASKYTGEIVDIKIYTTIPISDLDPSLAKIVKAYNHKIDKRNAVLKKYQNPGDMNYYKAGQIITETSDIIKPNASGKVKGQYLDKGVLILFYIKYKDVAAKGDKVCANFALKGVTSHVIEEGFEPYSEYRPNEEISTLVAPLSVAARKVPSIFLAMFGNKLLIEAKRQLKEMYTGKKITDKDLL